MSGAPVIRVAVLESSPQFTAALERALVDRPEVDVLWRPYRDDLLEICRSTPLAAVILVIKSDDAALTLLRTVRDLIPDVPLLCVVEELFDEWEWTARELGADVVLADVVAKEEFVRSVGRVVGRE